jgi:hypothetical protein
MSHEDERYKDRPGFWTHYAGVWFHSRLESLWARAFDAAGLRWSYEPFRLVRGNVNYLPDFWLPDRQCYAEVKPVWPTAGELFKAVLLCEWSGCPVWFLVGPPSAPEYGVYLPGRWGGRRAALWQENPGKLLTQEG